MMSDIVPALLASRDGVLKNFDLRWYPDAALTVVMAAKGYPGDYKKGTVIDGLDAAAQVEGVQIFHAGTKESDGHIVANGGRVLNVCAIGRSGGGSAETGLCGRRQDRLAGRLLPQGYRQAGGRARAPEAG